MEKHSPSKGLLQPAEWSSHRACWTAWPAHQELWQHHLESVRQSIAELIRAIVDPDPYTGAPRGERVELLVADEPAMASARTMLAGLNVGFHRADYGDIWLRDTAPVFVHAPGGSLQAQCFTFNGWGGKYALPGDTEVADVVAGLSGISSHDVAMVLEGGSIEVDGAGTCLTTKQCLLGANRNPEMTQPEIEQLLETSLGTPRVLWLTEGLLNDHTDGHIDTIARFVAPGVVVCMQPSGTDDPNAEVLNRIIDELRTMKDASGRALQVVTVPSPGRVLNDESEVMPASYVNFYIANSTVTVPTYGSPYDTEAVKAIRALFPGRRTLGVNAKQLLAGGGAFHCITQQQPSRRIP